MRNRARIASGRRGLRGGCPALGLLWLVAGAGFTAGAAAPVTIGPEHTFPGGDNRSCDICVHPSTGRPHVVWETNDGHIKYTHHDGTAWSVPQQIPGAVKVGAVHDRFRNGAVTMAIDSAGRVDVVYTTVGPPNELYHVRQKAAGGAWSAPVRIYNAKRAELTWVQMAGGRRGERIVTFEQGFRGYRCEYDGSRWQAPAPLIGLTSHVNHVCVGPDGVPRILFKAKRAGYEAYLAIRRRGRWKATQITKEGGQVDCPTGVVDASNKLHVIWSRCDEEGHGAVLKYQAYGRAVLTGAAIAKSNAHNFCRLVIDRGGALYAFMARRYPPKLVVRPAPNQPWSDPVPLGAGRQGYWFLEAAAHDNEVHVVYSNCYRPDRPKRVTYRKITRGKAPPPSPPPQPPRPATQ